MSENNARVGKATPVADPVGNHARNSSAPVSQSSANVYGDRVGLIALIVGIIALIVALFVAFTLRSIWNDVQQARSAIESAVGQVTQSAVNAAVAAERADKAERAAALSREYATQVYPELNRLGYPVHTPIEHHAPIPSEAYKDHDNFEGK